MFDSIFRIYIIYWLYHMLHKIWKSLVTCEFICYILFTIRLWLLNFWKCCVIIKTRSIFQELYRCTLRQGYYRDKLIANFQKFNRHHNDHIGKFELSVTHEIIFWFLKILCLRRIKYCYWPLCRQSILNTTIFDISLKYFAFYSQCTFVLNL